MLHQELKERAIQEYKQSLEGISVKSLKDMLADLAQSHLIASPSNYSKNMKKDYRHKILTEKIKQFNN